MTENSNTDPIRIAFMCVQNAGRSQMSTAFAERERERRGLEGRVEILTGGTHPADHVHDEVVNVMDEAGFASPTGRHEKSPWTNCAPATTSPRWAAQPSTSAVSGRTSMSVTGRSTIPMDRIWTGYARFATKSRGV